MRSKASSRTKSWRQIYSTDYAFAALLGNGRVVTWGDAGWGGDSSAVQGELKDQVVEQIYSTDAAFAALLGNGRVVTWGDARCGGDSSAVQGELRGPSGEEDLLDWLCFCGSLRERTSGDVGRC